ncbi:MAG: hypothetical protein ABIG55_06580 [Candidatus Omnitrophota bacterium]|nr:hypothetical protein [Candidatus Omnitrophota bacterium]
MEAKIKKDMKKRDVLAKLDGFTDSYQEEAVKRFYPLYTRLIEAADVDDKTKKYCKDMMEKLIEDSATRIEMIKAIKSMIEGYENEDL